MSGKDGGYVLPEVIDPPRFCLQIEVPNDRQHIAAFFGALLDLAYWWNWQRDDAHTGKQVADVWWDVWSHVNQRYRNGEFCDCPPVQSDDEFEEDMNLCDNIRVQNGVLQVKCCSVWQDVDGQTPGASGTANQPGGGTPQPAPGGGCQTYAAKMNAGNTWLLPAIVNTGDVLQFSSFDGATTAYAPIGHWYCPDGSEFIAGTCNPVYQLDAGAQMPTEPIGEIVFQINSVWYAAKQGVPFTVPGGVTNQIVAFQLNYGTPISFSGDVTFSVQVCNNQAGSFTHVFDLTVSPGGWVSQVDGGAPDSPWSPGYGFVAQAIDTVGNTYIQAIISRTFASRTLTQIIVDFGLSTGSFFDTGVDSYILGRTGGPGGTNTLLQTAAYTAPPASPWIWIGSAVVDWIDLALTASNSAGTGTGGGGGSARHIKVTVSGNGSDPFV